MGSCFSQPAQGQDGNQINQGPAVGSSQAALARPSTANTQGNSQRQPPNVASSGSLAQLTDKPLIIKEWSSKDRTWTREQLDKEREEFFDTRISGNRHVWQAIKSALEVLWEGGDAMDNDGGLGTAQTILTSAGVVLPRGDMHRGTYDETGVQYPIPRHIINDPRNIVTTPTGGSGKAVQKAQVDGDESDGSESEGLTPEEILRRKEEKGKGRERDMVEVRARRSDTGADVIVQSDRTENVIILRQRFTQAAGIKQPKYIKLMNMGVELSDSKTLEAQRWNGQVLHAMVVGDEKWYE